MAGFPGDSGSLLEAVPASSQELSIRSGIGNAESNTESVGDQRTKAPGSDSEQVSAPALLDPDRIGVR